MKAESSKNFPPNNRSPHIWILNGAALAPLLVILFSYMHVDESMREVPVLLTVTVVGAFAGRLGFTICKPNKPFGWKTPLLLLLSLVLYAFAVFLGFLMVRLGLF